MPAYNQAKTIGAELMALDRMLQETVPSYEIILVIDGNHDNTLATVTQTVQLPFLRIEHFVKNQGKGAALHYGLSRTKGMLVAFMDAGGDLNPQDLKTMIVEMNLHHADIVIGSKRHSLSEVTYPWRRRFYSVTYQILNRLLFRMKITDTQVGMKLFRSEVLATILPRVLVKRFAFDLELLVAARHAGYGRIMESPITLDHQFSSSVNWHGALQTLWDTLAVFYRLRLRRWYDATPARSTVSRPVPVTIASVTIYPTVRITSHPVESEPASLKAPVV